MGKPRFVLKLERADFTDNGQPPEDFIDGKTMIKRGISFKTRMKTTVGVLEPLYAVKQATLAAVVLSITKMIVSMGLVFIYRRVSSLKHVAFMHDHSKYETTVDDREMKSIYDTGDGADRD